MRVATIKLNGKECAGIVIESGIFTVDKINQLKNTHYHTDLFSILEAGEFFTLKDWYNADGKAWLAANASNAIPFKDVAYAPLYRHPRKLYGIGLNYASHAQDLAAVQPGQYPGSFLKPDTTVIGMGDNVEIPEISEKTTGEAEFGIVFGKRCKDINAENWQDCVAGFTTVLDMTAEDLFLPNPRYLTWSKSFDTFFSFGPHLVTPDEIDDVMQLEVATVINGEIHAKNVVANMKFKPDYLVSFHSQIFTWLPGDVLYTGTPRAVKLNHGDVVECRITGFEPLKNPVIDRKTVAGKRYTGK